MRLILCQIGDAVLKEEAGELGLQGPHGQKGLIGEPGTEGPLGDNEEKGAKGQLGHLGDEGPQGDDGDQGAQGEGADSGCVSVCLCLCLFGGSSTWGVLYPMVQVVHCPWTNCSPFTYLLKLELSIPFNHCKYTVFII